MNVRATVREHTLAVAAVLSTVSLALVFAAALRVVPPELLPRAPSAVVDAIPHVNALVSAVAFVVVVLGVRAIHQGDIERHRKRMGTAFGLFVLFLVGYLYRVALVGPTEFPTSGLIETVYYLILAIHITLAVVSVPLLFYTLLLAWSHPVSEIPRTNHRRVGKVAAPLWAISFALGVVVYLLVYVVA
jgi:putative membrane protein